MKRSVKRVPLPVASAYRAPGGANPISCWLLGPPLPPTMVMQARTFSMSKLDGLFPRSNTPARATNHKDRRPQMLFAVIYSWRGDVTDETQKCSLQLFTN